MEEIIEINYRAPRREIKLNIESVNIVANTRKLKAIWTLEAQNDWHTQHANLNHNKFLKEAQECEKRWAELEKKKWKKS